MKSFILCLVGMCCAGVLHAQTVWQPLNNDTYQSSLTSAIAVHKPTDNIIMTTINKGIFRSTDNGSTWHNVFDTDSSLQCVAVRSDGMIAVGGVRGYVFISHDGGATWSRNQMNTDYPVSKITFTASGMIIAGTGTIEAREGVGYDAGDGVFTSTDDGRTWAKKNSGIVGVPCVTVVAVEPGGRIWTAISNWAAHGSQGGLYYSDDNCESWSFLRIRIDGKNTVDDLMNVRGIEAIAFNDNGRMFISMRGSAQSVGCEFVAATSDITQPWEILSVVPSSMFWMQAPLYSLYIADNGDMWGSTIGGNARGIFASADNGATWERRHNGILPAISGRYEPIWFAEQSNGTLYAIQWLDNHVYRASTSAPTDVPDGEVGSIALEVAPNPVGQTSVVSFVLPRPAYTKLTVIDLLGRDATTLVDGWMESGAHRVALSNAGLSPGMYYLLLRTDGGTAVQTAIYVTN